MYPALAVLQALENEVEPGTIPSVSVLWVGSESGMDRELVQRAGVPFEAIPAAGVHGVGLRALPGNLLQLARGYQEAWRILKRFKPDVLFFTGGYVAVPMALAGRQIPAVLFVPDIEPGLALKILALFADRIAVTTEKSKEFFSRKSRLTVTGYPARAELADWSKSKALELFGLSADLPVLLVFGGSTGARSINRAVLAGLKELLKEMQIIHLSGKRDWAEVEATRIALEKDLQADPGLAERYRAFPYLHDEMGAALAAADVVLSRSGASSLGEFPLIGLPAILVPYPHAWRYQKVNAEYLAQRGAALILEDQDLLNQLVPNVKDLIRDPAKRERMRNSMRSLARPEAARSIAALLRGKSVLIDQERI